MTKCRKKSTPRRRRGDHLGDALEGVRASLEGEIEARGGFRGPVRRTQRRASRMLDLLEHVRQLASGERSRW